ncbi:MAG: hypothetical protein LBR38_06035, partial [Synergistaceae bacterium]|nr:hypothetical protein [Synergistaceae bacterium]
MYNVPRAACYSSVIFAFLIFFLLFAVSGPAAATDATAAGTEYAPSVYVFGTPSYTGPERYTQVSDSLAIHKDGYYRLVGGGESPGSTVVVTGGVKADIIIENLRLDASHYNYAPFRVSKGANVTLRLAGQNFLKAGVDWAALEVSDGAELTITSAAGDGSLDGELKAIAYYGAAIGG